MAMKRKQKLRKPELDNTRAFTEGWGLFETDSEHKAPLEIMRLDDPEAGRPLNCECDNTHDSAGTCCRPCWKLGYRSTPPSADGLNFTVDTL